MPTAVESIEAGLEAQLVALKDEEQRLIAALAILRGKSNGAASTAPRKTTTTGTRTLHDKAIINAIHANGEPASAGQIREALKLTAKDSNRLSLKLKTMVDQGLLTRQGERRGSRYTPA